MYRGTSVFNRIGSFGKRIAKPDWIPTIGNLPASITLNGSARTPAARYNAKDATASALPAWGYGSALGVTGTGDPTLLQASPLRGSLDKSIIYNGKRHIAANAAICNIATEDIYVEAIVKMPSSGGTMFVIYKYGTYGYYFSLSTVTKKFTFGMRDAGLTTISLTTAELSLNTWYFLQFCFNRDYNDSNGAIAYVNGITSGNTNPSSGALSLSNAGSFYHGYSAGIQVAYFSMYYAANMFSATTTGKAEMDALASTRSKLVKWW